MELKKKTIETKGIKIFVVQDGKEVARATLFILENDYRQRQFGYMGDVFIDESCRGQGMGTKLIEEIIRVAKDNNCYKIVTTSRHSREQVHKLYGKLGFKNFGIEFKMYLEKFD